MVLNGIRKPTNITEQIKLCAFCYNIKTLSQKAAQSTCLPLSFIQINSRLFLVLWLYTNGELWWSTQLLPRYYCSQESQTPPGSQNIHQINNLVYATWMSGSVMKINILIASSFSFPLISQEILSWAADTCSFVVRAVFPRYLLHIIQA